MSTDDENYNCNYYWSKNCNWYVMSNVNGNYFWSDNYSWSRIWTCTCNGNDNYNLTGNESEM